MSAATEDLRRMVRTGAARPDLRVLTTVLLLVLDGCGSASSGMVPNGFPDAGATASPTGGPDANYTVAGTITGLEGTGLILTNNAGDELEVYGNGDFDFPTALADGTSYRVTVSAQPHAPDQFCNVFESSGTVSGAGAQRSNGKRSIIDQAQGVMSLGYGTFYYQGPQGDVLRLDNMARCVRDVQ